MSRPFPPLLAVRALFRALGLHPEDKDATEIELTGRALVVATNRGVLDVGKATGVFASELTTAYYAFLDAGLQVDVASPAGGMIPFDPLSMWGIIRTPSDDRLLDDDTLRAKISGSLAVGDLDTDDYDLIYLAGGWGAAWDFGTSEALAATITRAAAADTVIGGVCHGPLGLINATRPDGRGLIQDRPVTGASNRQIKELGIGNTPQHPETELRSHGGHYEKKKAISDILANHWVVDGNLVTGQNQNAGPMVAREMLTLVARRRSQAQ